MGGPPFLDFPLGGMVSGVFVAEMRCRGLSMGDWDRLLLEMLVQCGNLGL